jgi:hypothetical protein
VDNYTVVFHKQDRKGKLLPAEKVALKLKASQGLHEMGCGAARGERRCGGSNENRLKGMRVGC